MVTPDTMAEVEQAVTAVVERARVRMLEREADAAKREAARLARGGAPDPDTGAGAGAGAGAAAQPASKAAGQSKEKGKEKEKGNGDDDGSDNDGDDAGEDGKSKPAKKRRHRGVTRRELTAEEKADIRKLAVPNHVKAMELIYKGDPERVVTTSWEMIDTKVGDASCRGRCRVCRGWSGACVHSGPCCVPRRVSSN